MILGFTGSRNEPTHKQKTWLLQYLLDNPPEEFHHGCCVGSDAYAHRAAKNSLDLGLGQIVLHPPSERRFEMPIHQWEMANCIWYPRKEYLKRNQDIVNAADLLIALPDGPERMRGSGTWHTIRFAKQRNKPIMICNPLGQVVIA